MVAHHNTAKLGGGIETHFPALPSHFSFSFICTLLIADIHYTDVSAAHAADISYLKFID